MLLLLLQSSFQAVAGQLAVATHTFTAPYTSGYVCIMSSGKSMCVVYAGNDWLIRPCNSCTGGMYHTLTSPFILLYIRVCLYFGYRYRLLYVVYWGILVASGDYVVWDLQGRVVRL